MKKIQLFSLLILSLFYGCTLPTVLYFNTQPFVTAYKTNINNTLNICIDNNIKDSTVIKSAGIKPMTIVQFRHSLEDALINTFKNTYTDVSVTKTPIQKGLSFILIKVTPDWNKKSSRTVVTGSYGNVSSYTKYELEMKITYQAVIYLNGEKLGVIENTIVSEKSTFKFSDTPDVFKDGIKIMCEDIYKQTIKYK